MDESWAELEPNEAARNSLTLVVRYLEAFRRGDVQAMLAMVGPHAGGLMAGLVQCAQAVVPVFRETVDDDVYIDVMDQFAVGLDGTRDPARGSAVQILNSQGGVEVPERWTGPGSVEMSAEMVGEVNLAMAAILNGLINITAGQMERDENEAFEYFVGLVRVQAARA